MTEVEWNPLTGWVDKVNGKAPRERLGTAETAEEAARIALATHGARVLRVVGKKKTLRIDWWDRGSRRAENYFCGLAAFMFEGVPMPSCTDYRHEEEATP